jgi:glucose/arabinose dehydrogenase
MKITTLAATAAAFALPASVFAQQAPFADYAQQKPGAHHKVTLADLPDPNPSQAVDNGPSLVSRPEGAWPQAPAGYKVTLYAGGDAAPMKRSENKQQITTEHSGTFVMPRLIRTAPNGDLFLSDSQAGTIFVLRGVGPDGKAQQIEKFATGLNHPFGIAFYPAENPKYVYVANTFTVVRYPYHAGDLHASGAAENIITDLPGYAQLRGGGHWTRDIVFSADGSRFFLSVGSASNVDDADTHPTEFHRADVLEYTPEGKFMKVYAHGLRNCVGEAVNPTTHELWCSTNERDNLGNYLVPDYVTSVKEDSFFGWPWYYMGGKLDPRLQKPCANGTGPDPNKLSEPLTEEQAKSCTRVDLSAKVTTPDVLVQPHMASLQMTFVPKGSGAFPSAFAGDAFAAEHGSWNRAQRAGYEVIHIPMHNGHADGSYEDFLTGFVTPDGQVWGRPVGVTIAKDGSMFVTDDGSRSVWHITKDGNQTTASR